MSHPDVPAEQAHVDHAYARLQQMRETASGMLKDAFGERGGTFQSLSERDIRVRNSLTRLDQLQIGGEALVFGRIDRAADAPIPAVDPAIEVDPDTEIAPATAALASGPTGIGLDGSEAFHIGRLAISDADQDPLVVDWRAPIAEPFYRATGAHPMSLRRRRHFLTQGRSVLDLEDELFGVEGADDGIGLGLSGPQVLLSALQRSRSGRMRDIVATVQREQDEIIRGPLGGVLVVQGGPGTGKTAVALHRAAYLLYTHRFPLERQGVLVVGPNPTFLRYIEHVLPSLGESGVELSTVSGLYGHVEKLGHESPEVATLKGDPRMARLLARAVGDRQRGLRRTVRIPYGRAFLTLTPSDSAQIVATAKRRPGTHNTRRRLVETLLWRHLLADLERRAPTPAPAGADPTGDDEVALPVGEPLTAAELGRRLRRTPEVAEALDRMWPLLTPEAFLHDLLGARPLLDLAGRGLLDEHQRQALHRARYASLDEVAWSESDIPLLDEARDLLGSIRRNGQPEEPLRSYGHVVVDEAQDLSPMQLRMLARRSLSGSMTVVGDIAQATGPWAPSSWDQVVQHLPARRGWRLVELTVNYRTPVEIMEVADRILQLAAPGMRVPDTVRASGIAPRFVAVGPASASSSPGLSSSPWRAGENGSEVADHPDDGATLATVVAGVVQEESDAVTQGYDPGTVGLLVPTGLIAAVAERLAAAGIEFGEASGGALDLPVSLLAIGDAKGLEFDSVVVVEPSRLLAEAAQGLRALYVAVTRSTRRLAVVYAEPLPPGLDVAANAVGSFEA